MKKNIFWFLTGAVVTFFICISIVAFNNYKKENLSEIEKISYAYADLDRALYIRADNRFINGDVSGSFEDMKARETIRNVIHSKNKLYAPQDDEAVDCLTKLVDLNEKIKNNPNDYKLYYERANLQNKPKFSLYEDDEQSFCSDLKSAVKDYSKVIELKPDFKEVYERRADATGMSMNHIRYKSSEKDKYHKLIKENYHQMISDYEKAIELNGASRQICLKLAVAYFNDGQYEKTLETYEKYPQEKEFGYSHLFGKAVCYYELKDYEKVLENLDLFIEYNPEFCIQISGDCLPSPNGKKAYYRLRADANWKLHRYKDWLNDKKKAGF